jgi:hypothetical protein
MNEIPQKDDSPNQLNLILRQMGVQQCSAAVQTEMIRKYNSSVAKLNPKNGQDSFTDARGSVTNDERMVSKNRPHYTSC